MRQFVFIKFSKSYTSISVARNPQRGNFPSADKLPTTT
jgi:hypothetical protein